MSNTLMPVITQAGLQAVFKTSNLGLQAEITEIALGDQGWDPDNTATELKNERRRVSISGGERISPTQIHITAVEDGTQTEYWVREIGFYLSDGSLLAIWSHKTQPLAYKANGVDLLLAFDMLLTALPAESVIVNGTGGVNLPPATTTKLGVMSFATETQSKAGTVTDKAVTPKGVRSHGDARYSKNSHRHDSDYAAKNHLHDDRYIRLGTPLGGKTVYVDVQGTGNTSSSTTALNWAQAIHPPSQFGDGSMMIVIYRNRYWRGTGNGANWYNDQWTARFFKSGSSWSLGFTTHRAWWG